MKQSAFAQRLKSNPIFYVSGLYGLSGGLLAIILFLVLWYVVGMNQLVTNKFFDAILVLFFVFFSIKDFKDNRNNGVLHYWQGMSVGISTFFVMATCWGSFVYFFLTFINPEPLHNFIQERLTVVNQNKAYYISEFGERWFREQLNSIPAISPFDMSLDYLKMLLFIFPVILILTIIMRRTPK